jgi:hypothetical protein
MAAAILNGSLACIDADLDDLLLPRMIDLSCLASMHHPTHWRLTLCSGWS